MAATALPAVGTVVELTVAGTARPVRTRVEGVEGAAVMVVAPCHPDGAPVELPATNRVRLTWSGMTALLSADGAVTERDVDVITRWWITIDEVARHQRRGSYRLRVARPVQLTVEGDRLRGVTEDLSEGGALVVVPAPVGAAQGQQVRVRLALTDGEELLLGAEVVRVAPGEPAGQALGLRFIGLDASLADRVRRFVLEEQFRRRGHGTTD